jgi:hypothetical protein
MRKPSTLFNEKWIKDLVKVIVTRFPEIEEVYLLSGVARGERGQVPDYNLLVYAGYDHAVALMTALARAEAELYSTDGLVHIYVENYGATLNRAWGGRLIPHAELKYWKAGSDFVLIWARDESEEQRLEYRIQAPHDRRSADRRQRHVRQEDLPFEDRRAQKRRDVFDDFESP